MTEGALPRLQRNFFEVRALQSLCLSIFCGLMAVVACVPLFSVLVMLVHRGGRRLNLETLTALPPTAFDLGGGFGNAVLGTLFMVGIAALFSVPAGVMAAIWLAEFAGQGRAACFASVARLCAKMLSGLPSILAGVFIYAALVLAMGQYSAWAGGAALAVLMLPTVMLAAEEVIRMTPCPMRDAALGMGCTLMQAVWKVVLPVALPGIMTGVLLAVARTAGETAPLLFTALFSDYWLHPGEPTASLAVFIYNGSGAPFKNQIELAWAAALALVLLVLALNLAGRALCRRKQL